MRFRWNFEFSFRNAYNKIIAYSKLWLYTLVFSVKLTYIFEGNIVICEDLLIITCFIRRRCKIKYNNFIILSVIRFSIKPMHYCRFFDLTWYLFSMECLDNDSMDNYRGMHYWIVGFFFHSNKNYNAVKYVRCQSRVLFAHQSYVERLLCVLKKWTAVNPISYEQNVFS